MSLPPPSPRAPLDPNPDAALWDPHKPKAMTTFVPWTPWSVRRMLLAAVLVGLACDLAVRSHVVGLAGMLTVIVVVAGLAWSGSAGRAGTAPLLLAAGISPWLVIRTSPWLVVPNLAAIALLTLAGATAGQGRATTIRSLVARLAWGSVAGIDALEDLPRAAKTLATTTRSGRLRTAGRGIAISLPIAGLVLLLLASGDRFFARWLGLDRLGTRVVDVMLIAVFALMWLPLVVASRRRPAEPADPLSAPGWFGRTELTFLLGGLAFVEAVYVASLAAAALGGKAYVERTTGLTYAEYARSGFFQLVVVACIGAALLLIVRNVVRQAGARLALVFAELIVISTVVMAVVSMIRLSTYREVFGLTMLRYGTTVAAAWIAIVMAIIGVSLVVKRLEPLLIAALVVSAYGTLVATNAANPEAAVVRENVGRIGITTVTGRSDFDGDYLTRLSDDAVPALIARFDEVPDDARATIRDAVCDRPVVDDAWSWNRSRAEADAARRRFC